jgi:hypothetical protein
VVGVGWGRGWLLVTVSIVAACARGPTGLRHRVQRGESLYRIAQAYGVSHTALARLNRLDDPNRIEIGQVIVIPHATREPRRTARGLTRPPRRSCPRGRRPSCGRWRPGQ